MDEKEAERRYSTIFLTRKDMAEFEKAVKTKVAIRIFRSIIEGANMISTEESVCHHTLAVTDALIYLRENLTAEKALRFDEAIAPKIAVFEHFKPKKIEEYRKAIRELVVVASRKYLLLVSEQEKGAPNERND